VLNAQLAATRRYGVFAGIGAVNLVIKLIANLILIPRFGVAGITLASTVMYASSTALILIATRRLGGFHKLPEHHSR
jgi:O-antigen/teichoic acid export membrane protein